MNCKYGFENNSGKLYLKYAFSMYSIFTVRIMNTKLYEIKFHSLTHLKGSFQSIKIIDKGKAFRVDVLDVLPKV